MIINAWFKKADRHLDVCDICFEIEDYDYIVISCFLAMFSVIKALLISKNIECKTHEGLIYLFKINFVDTDLFDRELFRFYCKTKELHTEFFRVNLDIFTEELAREVFEKTVTFVDYSKDFLNFSVLRGRGFANQKIIFWNFTAPPPRRVLNLF